MLVAVETMQPLCNDLGVCEAKHPELLKQGAEEGKVFWRVRMSPVPTTWTPHKCLGRAGAPCATMAQSHVVGELLPWLP